jgi:predicted nucleotidyltransferase
MKTMSVELHGVAIPRADVAQFCARNHIRKLSLFGSILTNRFRPESDIDVLVEFEEGNVAGFLGLAQMELELGAILGRRVDLRTPRELSRYFRDEVVSSALIQYERSRKGRLQHTVYRDIKKRSHACQAVKLA